MQRNISIQHPIQSFLKTTRIDNWWIGPLLTSIGLLAFIFYSTWAAFQNEHYQWGPYLSPFYAPLLEFEWWPLSPAFLILWAPAGFRFTCYYYRKAYYRSFFLLHLLVRLEQGLRNIAESGFYLFFRICIAISFILLSFSV